MSNFSIDVQDIIRKVRYGDLSISVPTPSNFLELTPEAQEEKYREIFDAFHDACAHLTALDNLLNMIHE